MDEKRDYPFTPQERAFFERMQLQFQNSITLICVQQDLPGQWRLKADGSGLERADAPHALLFPPQAETQEKPVNGVA